MRVIYKSKLFKLTKQLHLIGKKPTAVTLFEWILTDQTFLARRTIFHEQRHVWQYRWHLYIFFLPVYWLLLLIYGYKDHPYEKDARRYAERMTKASFIGSIPHK